ncbi:MAG: LamG-like jellyroll fold domain-containing protein [Bacteroidales bacterium]|nr:LamG-like jellyroll fold domain-containing protein [Bacteroidales bacterium]
MKAQISFFVIFFGLILNIQAQIPTNGLVGYWPFIGNANDKSGNNNNGIVYGATLTTDRFGKENNAYSFNGFNNYIRISDNSSLDISEEITISAWRYITSNSLGRIVRKINTWGESIGGYILSSANNYINTELQLNTHYGATIIRKDSAFALNEWQFVAMTYDGSTVNLYLNDKLYYSSQVTGKINVNNEDVLIGASDGVEYFAGSIDDIRIYNRALEAYEIKALYNESQVTNIPVEISGVNLIQIYPNPARDIFYIKTGRNPDQTDNYKIKIINTIGSVLFESKVNKKIVEIEANKISQRGLFFIHLTDNSENIVGIGKIIIE